MAVYTNDPLIRMDNLTINFAFVFIIDNINLRKYLSVK